MSDEALRLNSISPAPGRVKEKKRLGRGIGSGLGKTSGKGHKGQKARKSGNVRPGFEGGQMPLQKRLPKYGFVSRSSLESAQVRLGELGAVAGDVVDLPALQAANIVSRNVRFVKVFASGEVTRALTVRGVGLTKGARAAIEAAGGKVEE